MSARVSTATHLRYAAGFIALGLHADARDELAAITPADQDALPVLTLRAQVYAELEEWAAAAVLGALLCQRAPTEAGHWIQWAYAVRRDTGIPAAREILLTALALHPQESILHFNLACYDAQLGNLPSARAHLRNACVLESSCREMALADSDLEPIRAWVSAGLPVD
jgi:tetratricopeptide (TPR) repeat protein